MGLRLSDGWGRVMEVIICGWCGVGVGVCARVNNLEGWSAHDEGELCFSCVSQDVD